MTMFVNKGTAQGVIARDPHKVAEGVVLLSLRIRDSRTNPATGRKEMHFPTFVVFGPESDKALESLEKGQEAAIEYKIETRRKEVNGETRYFEDKVATKISYGAKPEPVLVQDNSLFEEREPEVPTAKFDILPMEPMEDN